MVKQSKEIKKVEAIPKNTAVCQNCGWHNNNPSFCRVNKHFTGRKATCKDFTQ